MNSSTTSQSTFDPFPGDEVLVVAYEMAIPAVVLGSGTDFAGEQVYHVFLTGPSLDGAEVHEVWAHRYELAEV